MTISASGTLASNSAAALTTLAHTNNAVGNCLVLGVKITSTTITVSSVTGGGATGWVKIAGPNNDGTRSQELWLGTVNATGAQTITVNFSSSNAGLATDLDVQEFSSSLGTGAVWTGDVSGWLNNSASTTITYPTLAPTLAATELYVGQARIPGGGTYSGLTSGFTGQTDANGNPYIYGLAVTGSVSPSETNTLSAASGVLAALISETSAAAAPVTSIPQLHRSRTFRSKYRTRQQPYTATDLSVTGSGSLSAKKATLSGTGTIPAVTYDSVGPSSAGIASATSPLTWSHTNNGTAIVVGVTILTGSTNTVTAVTYGGVTLPLLKFQVSGAGGGGGIAIYGRADGTIPTGTNTVSVSFSDAANHNAGSISLAGSSSFGTPVSAPASAPATSASVSVTGTTAGGMIVTATCFGGGAGSGTFSGTNSVTVRYQHDTGVSTSSDNVAGGTVPSAGGSQTVGFSNNASGGDDWGIAAVEVLPIVPVTGTGGLSLKKPVLSGSGTEQFSGSGGLALKKAVLSGTGAQGISATGGLQLKKAVLAGTGVEQFSGSGGLNLKKAVPFAGVAIAGSGGLWLKNRSRVFDESVSAIQDESSDFILDEATPKVVAATGTGVLSVSFGGDVGPNYAGSAAVLAGGSGTWVNPSNADGAPDSTYATWTVP